MGTSLLVALPIVAIVLVTMGGLWFVRRNQSARERDRAPLT